VSLLEYAQANGRMAELVARITDPASGIPDLIPCVVEQLIAEIGLLAVL